jgi:hypothetical protein
MDSDTLLAREIFWSTMDDMALARGAGFAMAQAELLLRQAEKSRRTLTPKEVSWVRGVIENGMTSIMALCARCENEGR